MALTASTLINDAELLAFPHITDPPAPRPMLLRSLGSLDAEIVRLLLAEVPHALSATGTAVTIVDNPTNITGYVFATAGFQIQQLTHKKANGDLTPVEIVTLDRLDDTSATHPAGVIVNQVRFLPVDPLGKRWNGSDARSWYVVGETVEYRVATVPTSPPTLASTLTSPDSARDFFLQALRLALLLRYPEVPERTIEDARNQVQQERLLFLSQANKVAKVSSRFGEAAVRQGPPRLEG